MSAVGYGTTRRGLRLLKIAPAEIRSTYLIAASSCSLQSAIPVQSTHPMIHGLRPRRTERLREGPARADGALSHGPRNNSLAALRMPDERVVSVSGHGSWASFAGRRGLLTAILTCLQITS